MVWNVWSPQECFNLKEHSDFPTIIRGERKSTMFKEEFYPLLNIVYYPSPLSWVNYCHIPDTSISRIPPTSQLLRAQQQCYSIVTDIDRRNVKWIPLYPIKGFRIRRFDPSSLLTEFVHMQFPGLQGSTTHTYQRTLTQVILMLISL